MKVQRSKTGLPTLSENGGGMSNTGYATIICGEDGQALKPIFIPRGYSNGEHAIFRIEIGHCVINASRGKWGESISVERITKINDDTIKTDEIGNYENGDGNIPGRFQTAADAALEKSKCYHCREPHYYR